MVERPEFHSDDEQTADGVFVIKTLAYRSNSGNKFARRIDAAILKDSESKGLPLRKRIRKLPKEPQPSVFTKPPWGLTLDYYSPAWFRNLEPSQQQKIDTQKITFLPELAQKCNFFCNFV